MLNSKSVLSVNLYINTCSLQHVTLRNWVFWRTVTSDQHSICRCLLKYYFCACFMRNCVINDGLSDDHFYDNLLPFIHLHPFSIMTLYWKKKTQTQKYNYSPLFITYMYARLNLQRDKLKFGCESKTGHASWGLSFSA